MSKLINSDNSCSVEVIGDDVVFRNNPLVKGDPRIYMMGEAANVAFVELKWPMSDLADLSEWVRGQLHQFLCDKDD